MFYNTNTKRSDCNQKEITMDNSWKPFPSSTPKDVSTIPNIKLSRLPITPASNLENHPCDSGYSTALSVSTTDSRRSSAASSLARTSYDYATPNLSRYTTRTSELEDATPKLKWSLCDHRVSRDILEMFCDAGIGQVAVPLVFQHLDSKSLTAVCCVNKLWKSLCLGDREANLRRERYLVSLITNKENPPVQESEHEKDVPSTSGFNVQRKTLQEINNHGKLNSNRSKKKLATKTSKPLSKLSTFSEEAQKLQPNERLDRCPRCSAPARVDTRLKRSECTKEQCSFLYCSLCRCPYHAPKDCSQIGSTNVATKPASLRADKKNLRRLL